MTNQQNTMETLEKKLLSISGKIFSRPAFEDDLDKILSRAILFADNKVTLMKGRENQCHFNSAMCWDANRDISSIATGYALLNGMWVQHSWVLHDTTGDIIETTSKRDAYFGFILSQEEAETFYFDNE